MEKLFICTRGWKRHSTGTIISEWEWKKLAIETRENHFEPYIQVIEADIVVPEVVTPFQEKLTHDLKEKGIQAKFKHTVKDGKPELDATFTFETDEK